MLIARSCQMILAIRMLDLGDIDEFLNSAVNPPNSVSITASLEMLRRQVIAVTVITHKHLHHPSLAYTCTGM